MYLQPKSSSKAEVPCYFETVGVYLDTCRLFWNYFFGGGGSESVCPHLPSRGRMDV